ncbi:kidney mitochondrial carrier protein 1-like isoform X1 [Brachionichthys hirsutus]|uniref:kidney mitochondrial carrier protein 1-like isoform X1 n=1 Tax=Brachionichthys hirsutus TaxID=412623 RepID=UPI0036053C76
MSDAPWKPFVFGGIASVVAECGTFPIDLAKTRLQVQGQVGDSKYREVRYRGMTHALRSIMREEGLRALYSGISPAVLRQVSYGTMKLGTYQNLKRLQADRLEDETLLANMMCGIFSGVVSSSIANPTDVLKIRMQAQGTVIQGSMMGNFINIYQEEGTRGLWKVQTGSSSLIHGSARPLTGVCAAPQGVSLTAQRAAIVAGVELSVYDATKKHLILSGYMGDTFHTHFLSSITCGLAGALTSNPVDVVRTRMMNERGGALYRGTLDCMVQTLRTEGFRAFYKGFFPNWLRLGPWNIIFFLTYEQLKKLNV